MIFKVIRGQGQGQQMTSVPLGTIFKILKAEWGKQWEETQGMWCKGIMTQKAGYKIHRKFSRWPCDKLDKVLVEWDAGSCVEDAAEVRRGKVTGDYLLVGVSQHTIQLTLRSLLHRRLDLVICCLLTTNRTQTISPTNLSNTLMTDDWCCSDGKSRLYNKCNMKDFDKRNRHLQHPLHTSWSTKDMSEQFLNCTLAHFRLFSSK